MQLPADFADLQDLADRFAISDDVEREAATDAATPAEKAELVARLGPRFEAINAYLDQHDDESAHLLGRLAEAACEVQIELNR
jgi:hypothetical protein